jgi:hypothetical protein
MIAWFRRVSPNSPSPAPWEGRGVGGRGSVPLIRCEAVECGSLLPLKPRKLASGKSKVSPPSRFANSPTSLTEERGLGFAACWWRGFNQVLPLGQAHDEGDSDSLTNRVHVRKRKSLGCRVVSLGRSIRKDCVLHQLPRKAGPLYSVSTKPLSSVREVGELANREGGAVRTACSLAEVKSR